MRHERPAPLLGRHSLLVTPDIQVIGGAQKKEIRGPSAGSFIDKAVVLGFRIQALL